MGRWFLEISKWGALDYVAALLFSHHFSVITPLISILKWSVNTKLVLADIVSKNNKGHMGVFWAEGGKETLFD